MWLPARFLCCVVGFSPSLCVLAVPQSASPGIPVGSSVMFAPMGGFETYLTAAVREKKVPIVLTLDQNSAKYFVVSSETDWRRFVYGSPGSAASNLRRVEPGASCSLMQKPKMSYGLTNCRRAPMLPHLSMLSLRGKNGQLRKRAQSI